ncbi:unnamed protein product [Linum trigynum]|uniref:Uncharacterized protein n=1 Tax=Linum trigynum TaxID=586398 RepID=A0AAV2CWC5_9ROSI
MQSSPLANNKKKSNLQQHNKESWTKDIISSSSSFTIHLRQYQANNKALHRQRSPNSHLSPPTEHPLLAFLYSSHLQKQVVPTSEKKQSPTCPNV